MHEDLAFGRERMATEITTLDAYGLLMVPTALWTYLLPAGQMRRIFQLAAFRQAPQRWFVANGWRDAKGWVKYDAVTLYMLLWMRMFGLKVPMPRVVRRHEARQVAQWAHHTLQSHRQCLLYTGISGALRVAVAATEAGLDLSGLVIRGGGEPVTAAKMNTVERSGATYRQTYAMSENGFVGTACAKPLHVGEVHLLKDLFGLISVPHAVPGFGVTVPALNLTTLFQNTPKIMLNAQVDDYGTVEERICGCPLEEYGYTTHIHDIHSYSKLVGEGVTLMGNEMMRILEETLPARFGGTPLDYQLIEQEEAQGYSRLYLIISPRVSIGNEQEVLNTLYQAMRTTSVSADVTQQVWQNANTIQIQRREPIVSARGKLLPLVLRTPKEH